METTLAWISSVTVGEHSGKVIVKIDDMMKPYLLQLKEKFTQYELYYALAMKSRYSIRFYELLKSYQYQKEHIFDLDDLKRQLGAEKYARYPDFKRYVLDVAVREICELTDLQVNYEPEKQGRRFARIKFMIVFKTDIRERMKALMKVEDSIRPEREDGSNG